VTTGPAEVFDLGYRPYEGDRTSRWRRTAAIWRDGIRISLGLGRGASAKIAPWLLIALALVPVLILIVIASFAGSVSEDDSEVDLPSYAEYYEFAIVPIGLFAAIVAPLLLCPDRRDGVLSLYAARPITATGYVAARWAAFFTVSAVVVWVPEALLFTWYALDAPQTGSWLGDNWDVVPRFLLSGITLAVVFTTLSLFAASFTTRRAYAAVSTLAVLFVGGAIGGIAGENFSGSFADALSLADVLQAVIDTVHWIFGDDLSERPLPGAVSALWVAGLSVALGIALLLRTQRLMRA
jgi:ABC-2 type transport system permease protein